MFSQYKVQETLKHGGLLNGVAVRVYLYKFIFKLVKEQIINFLYFKAISFKTFQLSKFLFLLIFTP